MQCHLPNFCSANCAWGFVSVVCLLVFLIFPFLVLQEALSGSLTLSQSLISVAEHCSASSLPLHFASRFKEPRLFSTDQQDYSLEYHGKKACRVRNLVVPVPTSALREALLLNGHHLTHLLQTHGEMWVKLGVLTVYLGRQPCRSNSVSEHRTWGYQLSVICKTTLFQIIMSSYWKHRVAETTLVYLQIRGSRSTVDKVRSILFGNAEKLRTIKVSLPGQGYTFLCYWGDSPVILPT